ncbi:unnamed protein product, partial [Polarella glacialis]
ETSFLCDTDDIDALRKRLGDEESDDDSEFVDGDISDDGEEAAWGPAGAAALEAAGRGMWSGGGSAKGGKASTQAHPKHEPKQSVK